MTVHQLILGDAGKLSSELTHVLTGHTRDALCVDTQADLVVSGGLDTTVLVYRLGPENLFKVVHKLTGHTLKVRDITPEPLCPASHRYCRRCKNRHCVGLYQAQRWRNWSVKESRPPLADRNSVVIRSLLSRASNI